MIEIESWDQDGGHIAIGYDEDAKHTNPRQDSNIGTMICSHPRYNLGDEQGADREYVTPCAVCGGGQEIAGIECASCLGQGELAATPEEYFRHHRGARVVLPLWLYDHSGISISCGERRGQFADRWDSGLVGFVFDTPDGVKECIGDDATSEQIEAALRAEVAYYDTYLRGEVYGYVVTAPDGTEDSCWGFVGDLDDVKQTAREALAALTPKPQIEKSRSL
jgi:hypothetical protein